MKNEQLTYKDAGVDIDAGNELVNSIKASVKDTFDNNVLTGLGGFGALYQLPLKDYHEPVLVSSTDGVGTKLKLAIEYDRHESIGIDLVAMCANDLVVCGAKPLFFLDYYATSKLNPKTAAIVIKGIATGCIEAGCSLVGGETAEMPGMYQHNDYDLAGFCVGMVDKAKIIDGSQIQAGDVLIALASSGIHSNGYSLVRKLIEVNDIEMNEQLITTLLEPTKIYVKPILDLIKQFNIKGIAHITGGGISENLPRVLPEYVNAHIDLSTWKRPEVFQWIQQLANLNEHEMLRTFNCGTGMIICVDKKTANAVVDYLKQSQENAWIIGQIQKSSDANPKVIYSS